MNNNYTEILLNHISKFIEDVVKQTRIAEYLQNTQSEKKEDSENEDLH